jgi:hypothetical protein
MESYSFRLLFNLRLWPFRCNRANCATLNQPAVSSSCNDKRNFSPFTLAAAAGEYNQELLAEMRHNSPDEMQVSRAY